MTSGSGPGSSASDGRVTTQRVAEARTTITQVPVRSHGESRWTRTVDRVRGVQRGDRAPAKEPIPGISQLRLVMSLLLSALCLLTVGGAILLLLLWRQSRDSGLLTTQLDRTWELLDAMQEIERWLAFSVVPVATAWIAMAAVNVGRATGQRRNAVVAALSLPIAIAGAWFVGREMVAGSDDAVTRGAGWALQFAILALPVIFLERIATTAEARHRPLRATYLIAGAYLAQLQFLGGLSTIDPADTQDDWGRTGAYLLIGALLQVLGSLSANEAARAIEEGTQHRYQLRSRFSESLLSQAAMT
jgi:hypothetical protein